jgi:hypothetical protein
MKTEQVKRGWIVALIVIGGIAGLIIDNGLEGQPRALAQMILWTTLLLAFLLIQLHESLRRPIQLLIATALTGIHACLLILFRSHFPLRNMIIGFVGIAIEGIIFVFLYARIGQWLDPKGPFGMTDAEREIRSLKKADWRKLFSPK